MAYYQVEQSKIVNAPPQAVYDVFTDYHEGHQAILPKAYFKQVVVEKGGVGAGTEVVVQMDVFGSKQQFRLRMKEPEPGRVLVEEDVDNNLTTTFLMEPLNGGKQTEVTIRTKMAQKPGLRGLMERLVNPPIMRRIYQEELQNLSEYLS